MIEIQRRCNMCGLTLSLDEVVYYGGTYRWCRFCNNRYTRIRKMYTRHGLVPLSVHQLHKPRKLWRTSPAFDLLYPPFYVEVEEAA